MGPSQHARPPSLFSRIAAAKVPLALWNVDTPEELDRALALGAQYIISNYPLRLHALLKAKVAECDRADHRE
eukprot:CAMPEP_0202872812 /NCGR_PEP_ID=MMETSP1391-20130828/22083_1 /ASSEMBLY_ACC=CAM_ASM_000867 /TAXON_ID=1034604 /ORGANISM="Chlamydomonas leiostraca, Strain SAG 11-49" /LENGTH=71 /DNA_ID=CAMNT_0049553947 /DNA_START=47 /DNA_END=262 /DNA_ORIENTATION=-